MRIVAVVVAAVAPFVACSGGSSGGLGGGSGALNQYVDRLGSAYCNWLQGCGKTQELTACLAEFNGDADVKTVRSCAAAADYYSSHQGELDACLGRKPACSTDDPSGFCPALDLNTIEKMCTGGGTIVPEGGTSPGGACGSSAANAYKCAGNSIQQCKGGQWVSAGSCTCSVSVGDPRKPPYASTCKTTGTDGVVECSYAGSRCMLCKPESGCAGT